MLLQNIELKEAVPTLLDKANLHNLRFLLGNYEYMFSLRDKEYEIRKLSNTYNANVIFSIKLIAKQPGLSDESFIRWLN